MNFRKRLRNNCGWREGEKPGKWIITNFLHNTLPFGNKESKRYKAQKAVHDKLAPHLNPERHNRE